MSFMNHWFKISVGPYNLDLWRFSPKMVSVTHATAIISTEFAVYTTIEKSRWLSLIKSTHKMLHNCRHSDCSDLLLIAVLRSINCLPPCYPVPASLSFNTIHFIKYYIYYHHVLMIPFQPTMLKYTRLRWYHKHMVIIHVFYPIFLAFVSIPHDRLPCHITTQTELTFSLYFLPAMHSGAIQ